MGKYIKYFLLVFVVLFYNSCKYTDKKENIIYIEPEKASGDVEYFFEKYHYITLETNQDNLLSDIDKIQIEDSCLWILDKKQRTIFTFDISGKYIRKLCEFGNGQEEYRDIADFQISNGNIHVLSRINKSIFVYKSTGEFIKSYKLDEWYDFFYITKNSILLHSNFSNNKLYNLIVYNPQSNVCENEFLPFPSNQNFSFSTNPFNISDDGGILLTQQYDYTVYSVDNYLSVKNLVTLQFNSKDKLPEDVFEKDFYTTYQELAHKSVVKRIDFVNINESIMDIFYIFNYVPHLTRIDMKTGENKTLKLEFNDNIPYVFALPIAIKNGYLINYLSASDVLIFDENFVSDKNKNGKLNAEDNPVLFFNKLRYE